jgi:outer membrane protein assembly factor BamA
VNTERGETEQGSVAIRYRLEDVRVRGNRTRSRVIASFVPLKTGALFDVVDPAIEEVRWRLLGTGWFNDVKLSLTRGSKRGWVVLLIEVRERNTLLVDQFAVGLSRAVSTSMSKVDTLRPYVGLGLSETNLLGLGVGVNGTVVLTPQQYGLNLGYFDPRLLNSGFSLSARAFHNYAREFFGRNPLVVKIDCPVRKPDDEDETVCDPDVEAKRAVVIYHRTGLGVGTGHEIASSRLRYRIDWLGEYIDVLSKPRSASTQRGTEVVPIDFRVSDGQSLVSSLRFELTYDNRDHPALTTRGALYNFNARLGSHLLGSDYDFARFEVTLRHWVPLPWNHVVSFGAFLGTVFGDAPFFYNFYAADLSDLLPSRVLELNLDRRRTLNLLGTSIVEMDMEDLAARIDMQYQLPLHRGDGFVRGVDAYLGAGVFLLSRRKDLRIAIAGYHGLARVPIDLTFDLGVQADTEIGLFKLGFSSLIGFSDLGRESP